MADEERPILISEADSRDYIKRILGYSYEELRFTRPASFVATEIQNIFVMTGNLTEDLMALISDPTQLKILIVLLPPTSQMFLTVLSATLQSLSSKRPAEESIDKSRLPKKRNTQGQWSGKELKKYVKPKEFNDNSFKFKDNESGEYFAYLGSIELRLVPAEVVDKMGEDMNLIALILSAVFPTEYLKRFFNVLTPVQMAEVAIGLVHHMGTPKSRVNKPNKLAVNAAVNPAVPVPVPVAAVDAVAVPVVRAGNARGRGLIMIPKSVMKLASTLTGFTGDEDQFYAVLGVATKVYKVKKFAKTLNLLLKKPADSPEGAALTIETLPSPFEYKYEEFHKIDTEKSKVVKKQYDEAMMKKMQQNAIQNSFEFL